MQADAKGFGAQFGAGFQAEIAKPAGRPVVGDAAAGFVAEGVVGLHPVERDECQQRGDARAWVEEMTEVGRLVQIPGRREPLDAHAPGLPPEETHLFGFAAEVDDAAGVGTAVEDVPRADDDVALAGVDECRVQKKVAAGFTDPPAPEQAAGQPVLDRAVRGRRRWRSAVQAQFMAVDDHRSRKAAEGKGGAGFGLQVDAVLAEESGNRRDGLPRLSVGMISVHAPPR